MTWNFRTVPSSQNLGPNNWPTEPRTRLPNQNLQDCLVLTKPTVHSPERVIKILSQQGCSFAAMCRLLGLGVMQLSSGGHATGNEYFAAPGNATLSDSQSSQEQRIIIRAKASTRPESSSGGKSSSLMRNRQDSNSRNPAPYIST